MTTTAFARSSLGGWLLIGALAAMLARPSPYAAAKDQDALLVSRAALVQSSETLPVLTGEQFVDRVSHSVVLILVGEGAGRLSGVGSGVIIRPEGLLLTAYHLVKNAREVQARLKNGETQNQVEATAKDENLSQGDSRPARPLPSRLLEKSRRTVP